MATQDFFGAKTAMPNGNGVYYRLAKLEEDGIANIGRLPYSIKVLLESLLRNCDDYIVTPNDVKKLANWEAQSADKPEIGFIPGRVILQDFTGVPAVVDLAALRSAMHRMGKDATRINPLVPVDLVIDHSVQVDYFGSAYALFHNAELEFERNRERYQFLKWGQEAFQNFRVVPPATGIVHQVNLEYLAPVVMQRVENGETEFYPDSLVGTDSHTTMINGLGVVGWGVGGIEAEAVMLGQPVYMLTPDVVGFRLTGALPEGVTATDLVLTVTQLLRAKGVVGKFVEFFGEGVHTMSLPDRATIANMAPEYGATIGFFPVDVETLRYMRRTGRTEEQVALAEAYCRSNGLFYEVGAPDPEYTDTLSLDMSTLQPSLAGPKRPQDRIVLGDMKTKFRQTLTNPVGPHGVGLKEGDLNRTATYQKGSTEIRMKHGDVVIAAITSCTNTSNPSVMIGAGLLAKKAVEAGLDVPDYVKTSLAPGSKVVHSYLEKANLLPYLEALGFHIIGYGCTTCIGNSGPLPELVEQAIKEGDLVVSSVLSGNRNFEGRVHPLTKTNYLASPPLVVAYALAGTTDIDLTTEPIGRNPNGEAVYLKDIWPTNQEIADTMAASISADMYRNEYEFTYSSNEMWNNIPESKSDIYAWDDSSTYIQEPPFFIDMPDNPAVESISGARCLIKVADSVTTDHISPAGAISRTSPAAQYLMANGVQPVEFNSYGSRRGNDRVMTRGTFANIRLRNQMAPGTEGGWTTYLPTGAVMPIYDASLLYKETGTPLVVLAGKDYGMGSSRDWAAKGTMLLGVKMVIAESYERIHRSNLVGMGILPLQFKDGQNPAVLGLDGSESFAVTIDNSIRPMQTITVEATKTDGTTITFDTTLRIDTPVEIDYYRNGGILHTVLRRMASE